MEHLYNLIERLTEYRREQTNIALNDSNHDTRMQAFAKSSAYFEAICAVYDEIHKKQCSDASHGLL